MAKVIRRIVELIISATVAQFGSTSFEYLFRKVRSASGPHSRLILVVSDLAFAALAASLVALVVHLYWKARMAQWTWVVFLVWSACGAIAYLIIPSHSIMVTKAFWVHFSGFDCAVRGGRAACYDFFIFTVPLLRGVSYSLAIWIWHRFQQRGLRCPI